MVNKILSTYSVGEIVDQLGKLKAKIADLQATEAELKAALIEEGVDSAEGINYRATVSRSEVNTTDWRAVVEGLEQTPALKRKITINTKTSDRVTVRVVSR